jgi:hypothetical protein
VNIPAPDTVAEEVMSTAVPLGLADIEVIGSSAGGPVTFLRVKNFERCH